MRYKRKRMECPSVRFLLLYTTESISNDMPVKNPLDYVSPDNQVSADTTFDQMYPRTPEYTNRWVYRRFTSTQSQAIGCQGWVLDKAQSGWPRQQHLEQTDNTQGIGPLNQSWSRYQYLDRVDTAIDWCPGYNGVTSFLLKDIATHIYAHETIKANYEITEHNLKNWQCDNVSLQYTPCEISTLIETVKQLDWTQDLIRFGSYSSEQIFFAIQPQIQARYILFQAEPSRALEGVLNSMNYTRWEGCRRSVGKSIRKLPPIFEKTK